MAKTVHGTTDDKSRAPTLESEDREPRADRGNASVAASLIMIRRSPGVCAYGLEGCIFLCGTAAPVPRDTLMCAHNEDSHGQNSD